MKLMVPEGLSYNTKLSLDHEEDVATQILHFFYGIFQSNKEPCPHKKSSVLEQKVSYSLRVTKINHFSGER